MSIEKLKEYRTEVIESNGQVIEFQVPRIYASKNMFTKDGDECFIKIPRFLWEGGKDSIATGIRRGPLHIYNYLRKYMGESRLVWPSQRHISEECDISQRTVGKYLKILIAAGLIVKLPKTAGKCRWGNGDCYFINMAEVKEDCSSESELQHLPKAEKSQPESFEFGSESLQSFDTVQEETAYDTMRNNYHPFVTVVETSSVGMANISIGCGNICTSGEEKISTEYRVINNNINKTTTTTKTENKKSGCGSGCQNNIFAESVATLADKFISLNNGLSSSSRNQLEHEVSRTLADHCQKDIEDTIEQYAYRAKYWGLIDYYLNENRQKRSEIESRQERLAKSRHERQLHQQELKQLTETLPDLSGLPRISQRDRRRNLQPGGVLARLDLPSNLNLRYAERLKPDQILQLQNETVNYRHKNPQMQNLSFQKCFVIIAEKKLTEMSSPDYSRAGGFEYVPGRAVYGNLKNAGTFAAIAVA